MAKAKPERGFVEQVENPRQMPTISAEEIEFRRQAHERGYDPDAYGRIIKVDGGAGISDWRIIGFSDHERYPLVIQDLRTGRKETSTGKSAELRASPKSPGPQTRLPPPVVPPRSPRSGNPARLRRMMNPRSY